MTGEIVVNVIRSNEALTVAADHVRSARRDEVALARKLKTGIFGAAAVGRPWPGHDAALCVAIAGDARRSWFHAFRLLLEALNRRGGGS